MTSLLSIQSSSSHQPQFEPSPEFLQTLDYIADCVSKPSRYETDKYKELLHDLNVLELNVIARTVGEASNKALEHYAQLIATANEQIGFSPFTDQAERSLKVEAVAAAALLSSKWAAKQLLKKALLGVAAGSGIIGGAILALEVGRQVKEMATQYDHIQTNSELKDLFTKMKECQENVRLVKDNAILNGQQIFMWGAVVQLYRENARMAKDLNRLKRERNNPARVISLIEDTETIDRAEKQQKQIDAQKKELAEYKQESIKDKNKMEQQEKALDACKQELEQQKHINKKYEDQINEILRRLDSPPSGSTFESNS